MIRLSQFHFDRITQILFVPLLLTWVAAVCSYSLDGIATDYYPVYFGAQKILTGLSPYTDAATQELVENWPIAKTHQVPAVVSYPLPSLLFISPLALLPLNLSHLLWSIIVIGGCFLIMGKARGESWKASDALFLLLFYPFFHIALNKNYTLLVFTASLYLCFNLEKGNRFLLALAAFVATFKPQDGALFTIAALILTFHSRREVFYTIFCFLIAGWGIPTLIWPGWISEWLSILSDYKDVAITIDTPIIGVLGCLLLIGTPWRVLLSFAQALLFPVVDIYGSLPLLIGYRDYKWGIGMFCISLSWIAPIALEYPNSAYTLVFILSLPYVVPSLLWHLGRFPRYRQLRSIINEKE